MSKKKKNFNKTYTVCLLPFINIKNGNGRIYTKKSLKQIEDSFNLRNKDIPFIGCIGYIGSFDISLKNVSHETIRVWIDDNKLWGEIRILDTPMGNILYDNFNNMVFRTACTGYPNKRGVIKNIEKLHTFFACDKTEDAFGNIRVTKIKFKNLYLALKEQGPFKRFIRNFFITGNAWGMFYETSHYRGDNNQEKQTYNTKESALKSAEAMSKKTGKHFSTYKCIYCDGYHIGKNRDNK